MDRPQSTLFPLSLRDGTRVLMRAYYKVHRIDPDTDEEQAAGKLRTFRRVLLQGPGLTEQYTRAASDLPVAIPRMLAVDVERLAEVQVALPGRPLDRVALHAIPGRRSKALHAYRAVGSAVAVIERCSDDALQGAAPAVPDPEALVDRLSGVLDAATLAILRAELCSRHEAQLSAPLVYCHGDVSSGNVLVDGARVGLIDPLWSPRWPGDDIALHATRLQYELPRISAWSRRLVGEMVAGYGDPALVHSPNWALTELRQHCMVAASEPRSRRDSLRRRHALGCIARALGRRSG